MYKSSELGSSPPTDGGSSDKTVRFTLSVDGSRDCCPYYAMDSGNVDDDSASSASPND